MSAALRSKCRSQSQTPFPSSVLGTAQISRCNLSREVPCAYDMVNSLFPPRRDAQGSCFAFQSRGCGQGSAGAASSARAGPGTARSHLPSPGTGDAPGCPGPCLTLPGVLSAEGSAAPDRRQPRPPPQRWGHGHPQWPSQGALVRLTEAPRDPVKPGDLVRDLRQGKRSWGVLQDTHPFLSSAANS